ncbi:hypothetical protein AAHB54_01365, partial [Bacillus cereus]
QWPAPFKFRIWVFNLQGTNQIRVFAFIVKRFRVFRAPLQKDYFHRYQVRFLRCSRRIMR